MKDEWQKEATAILRGLMAREGYEPKNLAPLLTDKGETLTARSLSNRISRGNFTFAFFLRCVVSMGNLDVRFQARRPAPKKKDAAAASKG